MYRILPLLVLLSSGISTASGAIVTSLSNLEIAGSYYDVTIHTPGSFNDIWDSDGNGVFGEGGATFIDRAPQFWGASAAAWLAQSAVMAALGTEHTWNGSSDRIMTPFAFGNGTAFLPDSRVLFWYDHDPMPGGELLFATKLERHIGLSDPTSPSGLAYVSYEPVTHVPLPPALWLFGSVLTGYGLWARKRKRDDSA